jgi:hypothetical protein
MKINIRFNVTQEDINKGCRANGGACPFFRALGRSANLRKAGFRVGHVTTECCELKAKDEEQYHFKLPKPVGNWIFDYDDLGVAKPFKGRMTVEICKGMGQVRVYTSFEMLQTLSVAQTRQEVIKLS